MSNAAHETSDDHNGEAAEPWFVLSLARGLAVIRAFNDEREGLSTSDVALRCDISRAAARRFLMTLSRLGYVALRNNRYFLQPLVLDLGYAYLSSMRFDTLIQSQLEDLAAASEGSSSLAVLSQQHAMVVARASGKRIVKLHVSIGARHPLHASSLGKVLLAYKVPPRELRSLLPEQLAKYTETTIGDREKLIREIGAIRVNGFALSLGELEAGVHSIAVPVFSGPEQAVAALNVSTYAGMLDNPEARDRLRGLLVESSRLIGRTLQASPAFIHQLL